MLWIGSLLVVYEELHRVAQRCMAGERTGHIATGMRGSRADRQEPASLWLRESASLRGGELHPEREARALQLGARKIRERLLRRFSGIPIPAKSTIQAVLDRHGLVERRGRVRRRAQGTPLSFIVRPASQ